MLTLCEFVLILINFYEKNSIKMLIFIRYSIIFSYGVSLFIFVTLTVNNHTIDLFPFILPAP